MSQPLEFVYKVVDGLEILLDVYLPADSTREKPAPVCLWWHGGGLFQGTRKGCPPNMKNLPEEGIAFISADYRLAPQTNIHAILQDVADAVEFVRKDLPSKVDGKIDPSKLAVSGGSAGGWLALLAGIPAPGYSGSVTPPPTCVAAIYPIIDIDTAFYTTKQSPVSYLKEIIPLAKAAPHIDPASPPSASSELTSPRSIVYHHTLQEADWSRLWFANTELQNPSASTDAESINVSKRLAVTKESGLTLPAIYVTSGTLDDKVDPDGARKFVEQAKDLGITVEWDEREGLDHLFDQKPTETMGSLHSFLRKHLL